MSSLWGSNKKDAQDDDQLAVEPPHPIPQDDEASRSSRRSYEPSRRSREVRDEPTERTRLLDRPRPPNSDGYLDPDDPAVCFLYQIMRWY
jgi:hypothetical protein